MAVYFPETIENQDIYGTFTEPSKPDSEYNALKVMQFPTKILPVIMPQVPTANDTIGHSINTKTNKILGSYSFGKVGSLQVGNYVNGTSGDIRITPDGITARNSSGTNTFVIDGTTGDAEFYGTIKAGSLVVGYVASTAGTYQTTAATAAKVMLLPDANTGIVAYASDGTSVVFRVLVGGANVGDVQIGNYSNNNGALWDDSTGKFNIRGTIVAETFTTGTSGNRVAIETAADVIKWYDSGNDVGLQIGLTSSTHADISSFDGRILRFNSASGTVNFNNNNLGGLGDISTSGTISAGTFSGSVSGGSGSFSSISMSGAINMNNQSVNNTDRVSGSSAYLDFNSTDLRCSATFVPTSANSQNIGNSGNRWNYLNCVGINKTVGTWGYFDNGVEMQDGTILSDTEALLAMEENKNVLTPYGATSYKPESLPKVIRMLPKCDVCGEVHPKDETGKYFRWVKKKIKNKNGVEEEVDTKVYDVDEGEDVFATISIMLGAIKELAREIKELKNK
jgi:hypothetical protein